MTMLIERIRESLSKEGIDSRTNESRAWLQSKMKNLSVNQSSLMNSGTNFADKTIVGKMYFFFYSPKLKDSLPYYDRFPLVLPIEQYSDSFLGLNLHYIHPKQRIILLDKLSVTLSDENYDDKTKFRINYSFLKASTKIYEKAACIKKYLMNNVKSKFLEINSDEWDIATLLPAENFSGAPANRVWSDSRKKF